jgi:hypothetical protein
VRLRQALAALALALGVPIVASAQPLSCGRLAAEPPLSRSELVARILEVFRPAARQIDGHLTHVDGASATLSLTGTDGVKPGDVVSVIREGREDRRACGRGARDACEP